MFQRLPRRLRDQDWVAAGIEVLIVVIGILIALQVDNWNRDRVDAGRGRAYLTRILADLHTDMDVNARRDRFMAQVARYGRLALEHAERGVLVDGSAWKTVLAYYQAGQFSAYSREGNAFLEMRDSGDLGLIDNARLRSELAFYYESSVNRFTDSMIMNLVPEYRQRIRGLTPLPVQDYIWARCYRMLPGNLEQVLVDCPPPAGEAEVRAILAAYARDPELARDLRYWLANQRVALIVSPDNRNSAQRLAAQVRLELDERR